MRVVGMDTSYKYLNICLLEDATVVDSLHMECFKQQSEWMIPKLKELMDKHGWNSEDIDAMVITEGPGSYTGIRIAMTVAKVFCSSMNIPLYTLSSTTFGSIMIILTSSGRALYSSEMIKVFIQTDLPEPVVPAISI